MNIKHLVPLMVLSAAVVQPTLVFAAHDDSRIVSSAKDTYVYKTYLKNDHVKIESTDGNVTLTGTVNDSSHKALAEDTVRNLPGVNNVNNEITVKGENAPTEKSDGWVEFKVKSALAFHRSVSATKTKVAVKDGVVTLAGTASSQAQKDLTTQYANDVDGVTSVNNLMTVVESGNSSVTTTTTTTSSDRTTGQKMDDASITAEVKATLLAHRSTSALRTEVKTRDGMVILTGKAKNMAEKDLVSKLVDDVRGVRSVQNDMVIE
jgi:hyperosmotically inducible protein